MLSVSSHFLPSYHILIKLYLIKIRGVVVSHAHFNFKHG